MTSLTIDAETIEDNPLDVLETLANQNEWPYERAGDEEMTAAVSGQWCDFHIRYFWDGEENMLQAAGMIDMRVPEEKKPAILETINMINERLALGHFAIWNEDNTIMFRHSHLVNDHMPSTVSACEKITDAILSECDKYYPVFQFVLWAGKDPQDALQAALLETVGRA